MKLLLVFLQIFKFAKISKILLSLSSMVITIGTYAMLYGWYYGAGIVLLILIHESGHYFAAKRKKLNVGLPVFIPFVGAWIELKEELLNVEVEAYVAYAGPLIGTLGACVFYYWGRHFDSSLALALAHIGFIINLFNLIPISPLDGGRISAILSPRIWLLGAPLLLIVWCYQPSPMLIVLALLAAPQIMKAWHFNPKLPENQAYYAVDGKARFEYAVLYLGLIIFLSLMIYYLQ